MDKQKILEWSNKLIDDYEERIATDLNYTDYNEFEKDTQHCEQLREEIKNLLELH